MRTRSKHLLVGLVTAFALAAATSAASAEKLVVSSKDFRTTWSRLTFTSDAGTRVSCPVSFLGSFHSNSIPKVPRALIGVITSAALGRCEGGTVTALTADLPWHVTYTSFAGTLPNITSGRLALVGPAFQISAAGGTCLARTDSAEPAGVITELNAATPRQIVNVRADETLQTDIDTSGFFCELAGDAGFEGSAVMTTATGGLVFVSTIGPAQISVDRDPLEIPFPDDVSEPFAGTAVVRNTASSDSRSLTINTVQLIGADQSHFGESDGCEGRSLAAGGAVACAIVVEYASQDDPPKTAYARVTYSDGYTSGLVEDVQVTALAAD